MESELRKAVADERNLTALLDNLEASLADQGQLLATPNGLLESQPALRKLKEGLLDAQLRTAQLLGTMSTAASASDCRPRSRTRDPPSSAGRTDRGHPWRRTRPEPGHPSRGDTRRTNSPPCTSGWNCWPVCGPNMPAWWPKSNIGPRFWKGSQRQLVDARASQSSALTANLISRLDAPTTGPRPIGPGRSILLLAGLAGGPIFGLAILLISLPSAPNLGVRTGRTGRSVGQTWPILEAGTL